MIFASLPELLTPSVEKPGTVNTIAFAPSVAPTEASKRQAIFDRYTETDARKESQNLAFGADVQSTQRVRRTDS